MSQTHHKKNPAVEAPVESYCTPSLKLRQGVLESGMCRAARDQLPILKNEQGTSTWVNLDINLDSVETYDKYIYLNM